MKEILQKFSINLRDRRRALGMTQRQLADKISYSEKAISKWESGIALPPSALLPTLSSILEIGIDEMFSRREEIRYYLGIDGGGSKTEFVLVDSEGATLNRLVLGPSNPDDVRKNDTEAVLREGIARVLGEVPINEVSMFAGISGSRSVLIKDFLRRLEFAKSDCGDSISCILELCPQDEDFVAVNLGVGSIVFAKYDDAFYRAGGYGYLFGDECGGFALGRDAISAVLGSYDGSSDKTLITDYLIRGLNVSNVFESLYDLYKKRKGEIAAYASCVFRAYEMGDTVAEKILHKNCRAIADYVTGALSKYSGKSIPVYIFGGLVTEENILLPLIKKYLDSSGVECELIARHDSLVLGALIKSGAPINDDLKIKINKGEV